MNLDQLLTREQKQVFVQKCLRKLTRCEFYLRYDGTFERDWKVSGSGEWGKPSVVFSAKLGSKRFQETVERCARAINELYVGSTSASALMGGKK